MLVKKNLLLFSRSKAELRLILYDRFTCDISFIKIRRDLAIEQRNKRNRGEYMFVTRKTVLGRMRQIKKMLFEMEFPKRMTKKELRNAIQDFGKTMKKYKIEEVF